MIRVICPECLQGKHDNCDSSAWNMEADDLDVCACWKEGHVSVTEFLEEER